MQVKTTMRYHLIPVRMAIIKKMRDHVLIRMWNKGRNVNGIATIGMKEYEKIKNRTTI